MNKIKLLCTKCKCSLEYISSSGSSTNTIQKEIWECPKCKLEVMISFISTRNEGLGVWE